MVRSLLLFFSLPTSALALTVQNFWKVPDGGKTDLSQTFTSGQTLPLSWQALNASTNDLWVTTFNYNEVQFSSLVARNIDISVDGSYTWTIDIPSSQLSKSAKYVLRFKKPRNIYNAASVEISSPGFLVLAAEAVASSSAITSPTRTASATSVSVQPASSTAATISSMSSSPSPSPSPSPSSSPSPSLSLSPTSASAPVATPPVTTSTTASSPLTVGAKVGIGVGIAAGVVALASLFFWLCCRRRRRLRGRRKQQQQSQQQHFHDGNDDTKHAQASQHLHQQQRQYPRAHWPAEGDWTRYDTVEMYGRTPHLPELADQMNGRVSGGGRGSEARGKELPALSELPAFNGAARRGA